MSFTKQQLLDAALLYKCCLSDIAYKGLKNELLNKDSECWEQKFIYLQNIICILSDYNDGSTIQTEETKAEVRFIPNIIGTADGGSYTIILSMGTYSFTISKTINSGSDINSFYQYFIWKLNQDPNFTAYLDTSSGFLVITAVGYTGTQGNTLHFSLSGTFLDPQEIDFTGGINEVIVIDPDVYNCVQLEQLNNIIEQANKICGCCTCGSISQSSFMGDITPITDPIKVCVFSQIEFNNLSSGNVLTIPDILCPGEPLFVYRNGQRQDSDEYTLSVLSGLTSITFINSFQNSQGGTGGENVYIEYYK